MDSETMRRIDNCRDILVGKVPDPKSQVEQITIALIYKFMDDIDRESIELGGKATFFTGEYSKYAWPKIMDTKLGGQTRLNLYAEALDKMNFNRKIPQLFRDIFKNAYLPYRDPETLSLFLKEINGFVYDHSERLGDAYEYLLSIMSSQGDAGQFRTPRHIIEFIVDVIDPKKNETILDPACGTAGFLISSYKHILKQNAKNKPGDKLTPDERAKLIKNIVGYDISPDMVRLSLVNMYLHNFQNPKIYEYDTLANEDRWNENYEIILANPPFMTPKGGIRPHKRFSIQANRSEVLFADYFMEHISPVNGRAGFIVPEGIIFQSGNAYKTLRKKLVDENYLWAVVSLPAGVFNPYSGVKTSILFLDRAFAKKSKDILFVKIENDGYGLGAQRKEIKENDLPSALNIMKEYLINGKLSGKNKMNVHVVPKSRIGESEVYNLSGDRYFDDSKPKGKQKWPIIKINKTIKTIAPPMKIQQGKYQDRGKYPIIDQSQNNIAAWSDNDKALITNVKPLVVFGDHTCVVKYIDKPFIQGADGIKILLTDNRLDAKYLYYNLKYKPIKSDGYKRHFSILKETDIPLPPIEVQREIVAEIEGYQKIIDGARQVVENWKPKIEIDPSWPMVKLGEVSVRITKGTTPTTIGYKYYNNGINFIKIESIDDLGNIMIDKLAHINNDCHKILSRSQLKSGDVLFSIAGALGRVALVKDAVLPANTNQALAIISPSNELNSSYLENILRTSIIQDKILGLKVGVAQSNLSLAQISDFNIPLPPLKQQEAIVYKIEAERKVIDGCKELIKLNEAKIKKVIDGVWGE